MQPNAELKITQGKESMTKSGKIFTIFQLLQQVEGFTSVNGDFVQFQPYEMFRVRRGQRGAMSVELEMDSEAYLPLGISEDNKGLVVVDPIIGSTVLMNWTRTSLKAQKDGMADPAAQGQERIIQLELGEGPVKTAWQHEGLSATVVFQNPTDVDRFGNFRADENYARNVIAVVAHNIEALREPNAFELEFYAVIGDPSSLVPQVVIVGEQVTLFRLDFESKDMFAVAKDPIVDTVKLDPETHVLIKVSDVKRQTAKPVVPHLFDFPEAGANFIPQSKLFEQELYDMFGADNLEELVRAVLNSETSPLARKHLSHYVVKAITAPVAYAGKVHVERVRMNDEAEGKGDVYILDKDGSLRLDRNHVTTTQLEGPVFTLEDISFRAVSTRLSDLPRRPASSGVGKDRGLHRDELGASSVKEVREHQRTEEPERPSRIPTREWIPQINQFVFIEDDAKKEMYFIADYDQYEHKFLLVLADSLRRERAARTSNYARAELHNEKGQLPVEPGRLRPFVLFH
ncbi:hypothetical protein D3C73_209770 [compost metagenome]